MKWNENSQEFHKLLQIVYPPLHRILVGLLSSGISHINKLILLYYSRNATPMCVNGMAQTVPWVLIHGTAARSVPSSVLSSTTTASVTRSATLKSVCLMPLIVRINCHRASKCEPRVFPEPSALASQSESWSMTQWVWIPVTILLIVTVWAKISFDLFSNTQFAFLFSLKWVMSS